MNRLHYLLIIFSFLAVFTPYAQAQHDPGAVDRIVGKAVVPDLERQATLRQRNAWQAFIAASPGWSVEFNESSGKPHRAFGPPISVPEKGAEARASTFIQERLSVFGIPHQELVLASVISGTKHTYVHYRQEHEGLPVINGHLMVKLDQQGRVVSFSTDVYDAITVATEPTIAFPAAAALASEGVDDLSVEDLGLKILPLPVKHEVDHRLVYEVMVHAWKERRHANYLCWVDAHTGELWYRKDRVVECGHGEGTGDASTMDAGADIHANGSVNLGTPVEATSVVNMPDLRITINGSPMHTDGTGFLATGIPGPMNAQVQLRGLWSDVTTNGITPSGTVTLQEGFNTVDLDIVGNVRQRSAYYHVNRIHDQVNEVLPGFTGMDIMLPTNVDLTSGDCNAFYDGSSINFYAQANGCYSMALLGDVVYHEYGHGINDKFYQSQGSMFLNGAMNEGYADIWALSITQNPILASGYMIGDAGSNIRRYDQEPKVYPVDLVGQVHADGEIICGAWWDTHLLLNNDMDHMMQLFADAFPGLQATAFDGMEGQAFRDVLIDALQADDDDGDITNGTPNGLAIVEGFAIHGITLISDVEIQHTALETATSEEPINVDAQVTITFPFSSYLQDVRLHYRVNDQQEWLAVPMSNTGGNAYTADIPAQPAGTVIAYYLGLVDIFDQQSSVLPPGATLPDPNLPYFILVGAELLATEDGDDHQELGDWEYDLPGDNASTGRWDLTIPIGSFSEPGDASTIVQPDHQHTNGGSFCWVTGNASSSLAPLGENDVDGGTTTILSGNMDLSDHVEPIFTYWRWYINDPPSGANPKADWWQVFISNDGGASWVPVEETRTSDRSWRRMAFRVRDILEPTATVRLKFHASDSIRPGQNLDGGSLVEAALDDVQLWDVDGSIGVPEHVVLVQALYPDPATDVLHLRLAEIPAGLRIQIVDLAGRTVSTPVVGRGTLQVLDVSTLAAGQYVLRAIWNDGHQDHRFSIIR